MNFYPGTTVRLAVHFRDLLQKTGFDPESVTVMVKDPEAVVETFDTEIVRDSIGRYHFDYIPTAPGVYEYRWNGEGNKPVAAEAKFKVQDTAFATE